MGGWGGVCLGQWGGTEREGGQSTGGWSYQRDPPQGHPRGVSGPGDTGACPSSYPTPKSWPIPPTTLMNRIWLPCSGQPIHSFPHLFVPSVL